jgi:DNA helicase-2/ATP-dependent DNA helicase PcrA
MPAARLEKLNPQQRRAVEYGGSALAEALPLLIIAGAGSGKTSTLAHRVAFLIDQGADPRRIMLLTFSRRAAAEMTQRVDRILTGVARERGGAAIDTLTWAGTLRHWRAAVARVCGDDRARARLYDS